MQFFISYARGDHAAVRKLARLLDSMGVEYFQDQKDIHWGDRITTCVTHGLMSADATIVVVSPASVKSQWVSFEIGYSMASGKKILPYLTHPAMELPGFLSDILHVSSLEEVRRFVEHSVVTSAPSESNVPSQGSRRTAAGDRSEKLRYLKQAADDGYIPAMFDYGMEVDDPEEKKRYLKMAADDGYIPAMHEYALLLD